jgi:HTH-type transcriptional regulator / antitoxin HigA
MRPAEPINQSDRTMNINPIRNEADYKATLKEVSALMDLDPLQESPEGERLDVLVTLVQAYEAKRCPIDPPDPIEAIKFRMDQAGMMVSTWRPSSGHGTASARS